MVLIHSKNLVPSFLFIIFASHNAQCNFFTDTAANTLAFFSHVAESAVCHFKECCNPTYIPADFDKLQKSLKERVYGQPLVEEVVHALKGHWSPNKKPTKALTISFHGWPGGGKNYVSKFIEENIYKKGGKSKFVHHFIGRLHFPEFSQAKEYRNNLYEWLKGNVSICPKQLFIFDEVDKMPPTVLNAIKPMIDYRDNVDGIDYRESVFIFLSNTGANVINSEYVNFWKMGRSRESLKLADFETLILQGAFNEEGGFHHSDTIKSNLIDHYIPFLPLEEHHVKLCIKDEFLQRNVTTPNDEHIMEAINIIDWGPYPEKFLSKTGCKRLSQKVAALVAKYY